MGNQIVNKQSDISTREQTVSANLIEVIKDEGINRFLNKGTGLGAEYLDSILNEVVQEKVLGEVPILKTILAVSKTWNGISNYLFAKKLLTFLFELADVSAKEKEELLAKLDSPKKQEITDQLLIVLDKHDRLIKSTIQGRLFKGMIRGYLSKKDYFSLTHIVSSIDTESFDPLATFYKAEGIGAFPHNDIYSLASHKLITIDNSHIGLVGGGGPQYKRNRLGIMLVIVGLKTKIPLDYVETIIGKIEATSLYNHLHYQSE
jgi:hypothetical protein